MRKTTRNISIVLIVVVAGALLVVPKLLSEKNKSQTNTRQGQDQQILVNAFVVKPVDLENEVNTVGTILANEVVDVKSELQRRITGIYFQEGTYVPKGKVLFKLDDSDLEAQLRKLQLDEELNTKQAEREKTLLDKGLLTADEYDVRETGIEKIRADMELIEITIEKTNIRAPFSGITGFRNVSLGSIVNASNVLTTLQDIGRIKIDFSIPEKYISMFKPGQGIIFKVEGYGEDFSGTVISFDPQINENTRSIILRATAANSENKLLPGSFVKVQLVMDNIDNAMVIPSEALVPQLKSNTVYLLQNGTARLKEVEIGMRTEKDVQIVSGINIGDTVITTNILRLRPESKVKLAEIN